MIHVLAPLGAVCVTLSRGRDGLASQEGPGSDHLDGMLVTTILLSELDGDVVAHYSTLISMWERCLQVWPNDLPVISCRGGHTPAL